MRASNHMDGSDAAEQRITTAGDDAERSDAEEQRITDDHDGGFN